MEPTAVTPTARHRRAAALAGALALGAIALTLVLAGCGDTGTVGYSEGTGDTSKGKELFTEKCGSCHTLADAGTKGQIGPNLDDGFRQSRADGLGESTIRQVVRGQIAYPVVSPSTGAAGMPADLVTGQDAEDVATYVSSVAGKETGAAPSPAPSQPGTTAPETTTTETEPGGGAATADGKQVFASAGCGSCHTLADAGASGTVGPSLDQAKPQKDLVVERVTNGRGAMPSFKDRLRADQIDAVAEYVSSVAGD